MNQIKNSIQSIFRHVDIFLFTGIIFICGMGLLVLFSASNGDVERVMAQVYNIIIASLLLLIVTNISPSHLQRIAMPFFIFGIILLICVALFGNVSHGARRWLDLKFIKIQPSEMMKIATPLFFSTYYTKRGLTFFENLFAFILLAIPVFLVMKQPDLGTALLIAFAGFYVIFLAGLSGKIILWSMSAVILMFPFFWTMLHDYQRRRIEILFDPYQDPLGDGYHTIQSDIAIGSGGFWGKGWMHGTQSQLDFLPERTTDFIFAVVGEEFGFFGISILMLLFGMVLFRCFKIATYAKNDFGRLLSGSITLTFFTYIFVNIGMVSGLLPVVGVPLPLISYGGSALAVLFIGFGMLMSVSIKRRQR